MPAPPTLIQDVSVPLSTTRIKTTAAFDVQANDVLVAYASDNFYQALIDISNSGTDLGWTPHVEGYLVARPTIMLWSAQPAMDLSGLTVTFERIGASDGNVHTGVVLTFRGARGVGNTATSNSSGGQLGVTLLTGYPNSAVVVAAGLQGSMDASGRVWSSDYAGSLTEVAYLTHALHGHVSGYYPDAGEIGYKILSMTGTTDGFQAWNKVALEVVTDDLPAELLYTRAR